MNDYFLTAPDEPTMVAVLKAIWETNNPPLEPDASPPEYSEQGWVTHGFPWELSPAQLDANGDIVTGPELKPGYHALMRVHAGPLGPISIGMLAASGIECVDVSDVLFPPIVFQ